MTSCNQLSRPVPSALAHRWVKKLNCCFLLVAGTYQDSKKLHYPIPTVFIIMSIFLLRQWLNLWRQITSGKYSTGVRMGWGCGGQLRRWWSWRQWTLTASEQPTATVTPIPSIKKTIPNIKKIIPNIKNIIPNTKYTIWYAKNYPKYSVQDTI